jgi:hypothetical protein
MTIVSAKDGVLLDINAVPLPRYAQIIGLDECSFFGVRKADTEEGTCDALWTHENRKEILRNLAQAQAEIEGVLRYPLSPRWVKDENVPYRRFLTTNWGKIIEFGVRAEETVQDNLAATDDASDPLVFGPVGTTVTDPNEIVIYHHGTSLQIHPSGIDIAAGKVTIEIPRCRLVAPAYLQEESIDYDDLAKFASVVDVKRVYNDPGKHGELYWLRTEGEIHMDTQPIYANVSNHEIGSAEICPASYSSDSFRVQTPLHKTPPSGVNLTYCAGLKEIPLVLEDAVVRLAHSRMPAEPCSCEAAHRVWERDRFIPDFVPTERLNCPFGTSDGAWFAWKVANKNRLVRAGIL